MPKDEFDPEDPMELCGVGLLTEEDTTEAMAECFIEEFLRLGYNHKQILALFRNPFYVGVNMVLQNRGEPYVRDVIAQTFARWGRLIQWPPLSGECAEAQSPEAEFDSTPPKEEAAIELDPAAADPMGGAVPKLNT
jgi:hypothetical protein